MIVCAFCRYGSNALCQRLDEGAMSAFVTSPTLGNVRVECEIDLITDIPPAEFRGRVPQACPERSWIVGFSPESGFAGSHS